MNNISSYLSSKAFADKENN